MKPTTKNPKAQRTKLQQKATSPFYYEHAPSVATFFFLASISAIEEVDRTLYYLWSCLGLILSFISSFVLPSAGGLKKDRQ